MGAVYSSLTRSVTVILSASPSISAAFGRLGARKATEGYQGIIFLFLMVLIAVFAASQVGSIRDEEAAGRLDHLLVHPVRRVRWLASRFALSIVLVLVAGLAAGLATWAGGLSQHTGVGLRVLLVAGMNATIPGLFVLGAGVMFFGLRPRLCSFVAYGIVVWSFLVDLLGSLIKGSDLLRNSSLFTHVALAPAAKPNLENAAIILGLAFVGFAIGALAFDARDIEYA